MVERFRIETADRTRHYYHVIRLCPDKLASVSEVRDTVSSEKEAGRFS